jgi:hypothetical protein
MSLNLQSQDFYNQSTAKIKDLLDVWYFVELLTPSKSDKLEDLFKNALILEESKREFIKIQNDSLFLLKNTPYLNKNHYEKGAYWHVYLGNLNWTLAEKCIREQLKQQNDTSLPPAYFNFSKMKIMPVAAFIVTEDGLFFSDSLLISNAAWALGKILKGDFQDDPKSFFNFNKDVENINYEILNLLNSKKKEEHTESNKFVYDKNNTKLDDLPFVTYDRIQEINAYLLERLNIDPKFVMDRPDICLKKKEDNRPNNNDGEETKKTEKEKFQPSQPEMLNSFFCDEIRLVQRHLKQMNHLSAIGKYLGMGPNPCALDPLQFKFLIDDALRPKNYNKAAWPRSLQTPLSLLQEAALSNVFSDYKKHDRQLFSVNGPPGTGKTTLLYDLIINIYVERSIALLAFEKPEDAFQNNIRYLDERNKFTYNLRDLDESLKGFETIIVSTNNAAVQNISKELPLKSKLDPLFREEIDYFRWLANAHSLDQENWGMFSAVLGRSDNRHRFIQKFWNGNPEDAKSNIPQSNSFGMAAYLTGLKSGAFQNMPLKHQEEFQKDLNLLKDPQKIWEKAQQRFSEKLAELNQITKTLEFFIEENPKYHTKLQGQITEIDAFLRNVTSQTNSGLLDKLKALFKEDAPESVITRLKLILKSKKQDLKKIKHKKKVKPDIALLKKYGFDPNKIEKNLFTEIDPNSFDKKPFESTQFERLRIALFQEALHLHEIFVKVNARYFWNNLKFLMDQMRKGFQDKSIKREFLKAGWHSFFMVVPVVSSTFHSFRQMFSSFGAEELGWLIIDEAAQTLPQQALGAIFRSRHVIAVGDPLQTEPVQTLGDPVINQLFDLCQLSTKAWSPSLVSVQNLVDRTMGLQADYGGQKVGFPLLVHRRCFEPMFSMCNALAYDNRMIYATSGMKAPNALLGPSQWFDIQDKITQKNIYESAGEAHFLIQKIKEIITQDPEKLKKYYVITFFRHYAYVLRRQIYSQLGPQMLDFCKNNIGTIHSFQGKENDYVFFLLGAQHPQDKGARYQMVGKPNVLNVGISRARKNIYFVGNKKIWSEYENIQIIAGFFDMDKTKKVA